METGLNEQPANHGCHCFDRASYWLLLAANRMLPTQALAFSPVSIQTHATQVIAVASDCVWMETGLYLEPSCAEAELEKYSSESTESTRQRLYCRVQFSSSVTDKSTIAPVAFDLFLTPASLYLVEGLAWWDWPFIWCTNQLLSFSVLTLLVGSSDL